MFRIIIVRNASLKESKHFNNTVCIYRTITFFLSPSGRHGRGAGRGVARAGARGGRAAGRRRAGQALRSILQRRRSHVAADGVCVLCSPRRAAAAGPRGRGHAPAGSMVHCCMIRLYWIFTALTHTWLRGTAAAFACLVASAMWVIKWDASRLEFSAAHPLANVQASRCRSRCGPIADRASVLVGWTV